MNMGRFINVTGIEEKPIRAMAQDGWHQEDNTPLSAGMQSGLAKRRAPVYSQNASTKPSSTSDSCT
jgi:hypothetical protein